MEDEDIKCVIADICQRTLQPTLMTVDPLADVLGHQESKQGRYRQGEELRIGGTPVHVGSQVFRE